MVSATANRAAELPNANNVSPSKQEVKLAKKQEKEARKARRKSENEDDWDPCEDIRVDEYAMINQIRDACREEIDALWDQTKDVVGDYRVCRFLRAQGGDVTGAITCFKAFLNYRVKDDHLVERLRREMVENQIDCQGPPGTTEFCDWYLPRRNPYLLSLMPVGYTPSGDMVIYSREGLMDPAKFMDRRHENVSLQDDKNLVIQIFEWMAWKLDKMCWRTIFF